MGRDAAPARGLVIRTREASGPRPLPLRGAALNGWTRMGRRAGESLPDEGGHEAAVPARKYGPDAKSRRRRSAGRRLSPIARREETPRKRLGRLTPASQEADRKASAYSGAPLPSLFKGARIC